MEDEVIEIAGEIGLGSAEEYGVIVMGGCG